MQPQELIACLEENPVIAAISDDKWEAALESLREEVSVPIRPIVLDLCESASFDLLLLDIEMPGIDGVTLAKTIRRTNKSVNIVFITGYSDYISEGYEVSALHYLVKPVDREKFIRTLDRAYENALRYMQYLTLKLPDSTVRVPFGEIRYLEVRQNYVTVYADRAYTVKQPLSEFERQLASDNSFFRVGRSYIVNLRCIRQAAKKEIILLDGTAIPLPRGMYEPLNREMIKRL